MIKKFSIFLCTLIVFAFGAESKTVMAESSDNTAHFTLNISGDRAEITILESDCSVIIENGVYYVDGTVIYEEENNVPANDADKALLEELSEWKENHPVNALDFSDNVTDIITRFMPYDIYSISFGKNLKSIGDYTFGYSKIEELNFPDTLTYIGKCAFEGWENLQSITLPKNLEILKEGAFFACPSLTDITVLSRDLILEENCFGFSNMGTPLEGMIVRGYKGSTAETYAEENGFKFIALDEPAATTTQTSQTTTATTVITTEPNKLTFTPNPKFVEFLEETNREATVRQTDKGVQVLVYNYSNDPTGHPILPLKMTVPSGWQITYSIEAIDPSPQTVGEGIVNGNGYFIYYVLVEKTGDVVYTENEILDWYLSMDIGSESITTTTAAVTTTADFPTSINISTEVSTVPTTVTTTAVITTETGTNLPQTGYSIWYQSLVAVAMGMVGIGSAVIVRSGVLRKKDSNG